MKFATVFLAMAIAACVAMAQSDKLPPKLVGFTFSPAGVDVTSASQTINTIHLKSKGSIAVAVFGTPTLDLTKIDPGTIVGRAHPDDKAGKWQVSYLDLDNDGFMDLVARFDTGQLLLGPSDTQAVLEGRTPDNRTFPEFDSVQIVSK